MRARSRATAAANVTVSVCVAPDAARAGGLALAGAAPLLDVAGTNTNCVNVSGAVAAVSQVLLDAGVDVLPAHGWFGNATVVATLQYACALPSPCALSASLALEWLPQIDVAWLVAAPRINTTEGAVTALGLNLTASGTSVGRARARVCARSSLMCVSSQTSPPTPCGASP
jgi:hypothetical protein